MEPLPRLQIDWITASTTAQAAVLHNRKLYETGEICSIDRHGEVKTLRQQFVPVEGSHDTQIIVRADPGNVLWISGNPCKYFQGHNLFGSDDAFGLWLSAGVSARESLGLFPGVQTWEAFDFSAPRFTRIDITRSYRFGSDALAREWIRDVAASGRSRHGGALRREGTVYFGQHSRRWSMKVYSKFDEIAARGRMHRLSLNITDPDRVKLADWCEGVVRFELCLRGMEIHSDPLTTQWMYDRLRAQELHPVWQMYYETIEFNRNSQGATMDIVDAQLPAHLAGYLARWRLGEDFRLTTKKPTFYRVRAQLKAATGIDIASSPPTKPDAGAPQERVSPQLDPAGWDPEPIEGLMFKPDTETTRLYGF
jgi:hypothetical protein